MKSSLIIFKYLFLFLVLTPFLTEGRIEDCFGTNQNNIGKDYKNGNFFGKINQYNKELLKTAISAMTHSCIITQKKSRVTLKLLKSKGWEAINEEGLAAKNIKDGMVEPSAGEAMWLIISQSYISIVFRGTGVKGLVRYKVKLLKNTLMDSNNFEKDKVAT